MHQIYTHFIPLLKTQLFWHDVLKSVKTFCQKLYSTANQNNRAKFIYSYFKHGIFNHISFDVIFNNKTIKFKNEKNNNE